MADALKEMFNKAYYRRLADSVQEVVPRFQREAFVKDAAKGIEGLELNARLRRTSETLRTYLPQDFHKAVDLLKEVAQRMPGGYTALVYPDFVALHGLHDAPFSLEALKYFTTFGSSEFAVREFLRRDVKGTLKVMRNWAGDENEHVRRLASEGSRPRLPWSFRLDAVVKDPALTKPLLHQLRTDPSLYVRKSVANHLNDVAKDHPAFMLDVLDTWKLDHPHTAWIAKHACRNLIKQGDARALALFAFRTDVRVRLDALRLSSDHITLGDVLEFAFTLRSEAKVEQRLVVDYRMHYRKAGGHTTAKVFKLKELLLAPRDSVTITKRQRIQDFSTRKHHAGTHTVEVLVNGHVLAQRTFELRLGKR